MRKIRFFITFLFLWMLCSCNSNGNLFDSNRIKVSIIDSEFFTAEDPSGFVSYNSDYHTTLHMRDDYVVNSCSYFDSEINKIDENTYSLTLRNVCSPVRVRIVASRDNGFYTENEVVNASIKYNYNDGSNRFEIKNYQLSYHIRPNTWTAVDVKRDGYTLNGWNTKSDSTGEHIGLGSRVSVGNNDTLELYAEWVKWTPVTDFKFKTYADDTAMVIGYLGSGKDEYICLPEAYNGYTVTAVGGSLTTNIPCAKIASKTLILPNTIRTIEENAFVNSAFENVYFSDNIFFTSYKCFNYNIPHYFIHAYQTPKFQEENHNARFPDNIDLLIQYENEKKIVLYGGCNLTYGIYSPMIEEAFSEYKVINCGLNGEFDSLFQMQIIEEYLHQEDIFIHSAEQMNPHQFMTRRLVDYRILIMVEGNYDLLSIADFSDTPYMIESYTVYNQLRMTMKDSSYEEDPGVFNTYGDYLEDRNYFEINEESRDISYTEGWRYAVEVLKGEGISVLGSMYNEISAKGVQVYFTQSPMNENSCEEEIIYEKAEEFQKALEEAFQSYNVTIISNTSDYIFKGRYFFDTDYHLNYYGAELRTEKLIQDLKKVGVK